MRRKVFFLLAPAIVLMVAVSIVPLLTVLNYSQHDLFAGSIAGFVGLENYKAVFSDGGFMASAGRQFAFTFLVLLIEIPLGIALALTMPRKGPLVGVCLVILGIPLLIPWNVVGIIWRLFTRMDIGVMPVFLGWFGVEYTVSLNPVHAWWTVVLMDVWHWTPLVVLLVYAGLQSIPREFYQAARVDAAKTWATFRYITLPKLRHVLIVAVLLRAMDSFRIYDEPFVLTAGGPGNATELLSIYTAKAIGGFNMGYSAAVSLVYMVLVVVLSYVLYIAMTRQKE
jgi:glycerol transport system permease protein